jgi:putative endonuclease
MWVLLHIERFRTRRQAMRREWQLKRDRKFRKILSRDIWAPRNV